MVWKNTNPSNPLLRRNIQLRDENIRVTIIVEKGGRREEGIITINTLKEPERITWGGKIVSLFWALLRRLE